MREPKKDSKQSSCTCPPKGPEPEHSDARPPRRTLTSDEARKLAGDGLGAERIAFFQRKSSTFVDELNSAGCRHCGARSPLAAGRELYGKPHLLALEIPECSAPRSLLSLTVGRRVKPVVEAHIRELKATGMGILKIARTIGVGTSVVQRVVGSR